MMKMKIFKNTKKIKNLISILFLLFSFMTLSTTAFAKHGDKNHSCLEEKCSVTENLSQEQKEKLLAIRREYFTELREIQEKFKSLRKEANHCMMNNDETRYEEVHDKMNELKLEREHIKQTYKRKINKILQKQY